MQHPRDDIQLIREFRRALADELAAARTGPGAEPIPLVAGRRVARIGDRTRYRFTAERALPGSLATDVELDLRLDDTQHQVIIVGIDGLDLTLALRTDLGAHVERAALHWDPTFLLEELSRRLQERRPRDNRGGDLLLRYRREPGQFDEIELPSLNKGQSRAVRRALASPCTFIWGPPGTGKTQTIGHLVADLVRRGRSVLLVSHTNVAIDEAVLRTADQLGSDLPDGEILRVGSAYGPRLAERPRLLPSTHVKEREVELAEAIEYLRKTRDAVWAEAAVYDRAVQLDGWVRRLPRDLSTLNRLMRELDRALDNHARIETEIETRRAQGSRLNGDFDRRQAQQTIREAHDALRDHMDSVCRVPERYGLLERSGEIVTATQLEAVRARVIDELREVDVDAARAKHAQLQRKLEPLDQGLAACQRKLEHLEDDLVADALVVACTLTAAYMRTAIAGRSYDTVVIDEVSMAPIPAAWFAANLAERAVVAVGDFRQLAPIALAETPNANRWLKRDVFEVSGIRKSFDAGQRPAELMPLPMQHRMARDISSLARKLAYRDLLQDADETNDDRELDPWFARGVGFDCPTTVVNLEPLGPWASSVRRGDRASRLNVLSAAVSIDVLARLLKADRPPADDGRRRVLVISPYRPQAELLGAMIRARGFGEDATAGTIHAFQGSEASVVILDLTVAEPHYRVAMFDANRNEDYRRMLNVAVTRARRRLVVIGDLDFVRRLAADTTPIRTLLRELMDIKSSSVRAPDVLTLQSGSALCDAIARADREVIWFVDRADREPQVCEQLCDAGSRGVAVHVISPDGSQSRLGIRSALTDLNDAGAAVHVKDCLRESLLIVDRRFVAVRGRGTDGWSMWDDPQVAAQVARAHHADLIASLPDRHRARGCHGIFVLREGDHRSPGSYARCLACGASAREAQVSQVEHASVS